MTLLSVEGMTTSMLGEASSSSIRTGLDDSIKVLLTRHRTTREQFSLCHQLITAAGSGTIGSFLATPTDLVRIPFQSY
jgi:hypothetical protein